MTVSSMIPPLSFKRTDRVEEYGAKDDRDEGVSHSRKAVAVVPRKLFYLLAFLKGVLREIATDLDCTMCPTSKSPTD